MNRLITTLFCFLLITGPANAQQRELKSGLNYTTLSKPKMAAPAEEASIESEDSEDADQDPATVVWNKYKELATGQTPEQKAAKQGKPEKPKAPTKPGIEKPAASAEKQQAASQQSGFESILQEWKNTKKSQREMRSKSFSTPPAPAKPTLMPAKDEP